jgi:hypothetical protein
MALCVTAVCSGFPSDNFCLHKTHTDEVLSVSPRLRNYWTVFGLIWGKGLYWNLLDEFNFDCEIWGFHGGKYSSRRLLGCDSVQCCGRIPTFRRALLSPSCRIPTFRRPCCFQLQGDDGGSRVLRNIGILPQNYTASQIRRPRIEFNYGLYVYTINPTFTGTSNRTLPTL